jgi:hypothetical protein
MVRLFYVSGLLAGVGLSPQEIKGIIDSDKYNYNKLNSK